MRGDTLAEGIAVKAPGRITAADRARSSSTTSCWCRSRRSSTRSACSSTSRRPWWRAPARPALPPCCKDRDRFKGRNVGLVLCGGNIDTRLLASVLTRELAREGRLTQLTIDLVDRPGQLAKVANLLGEAGANIVEVYHQRVFSDLPAKGALLERGDRDARPRAPGRDGCKAARLPASRSRCAAIPEERADGRRPHGPARMRRRSTCCASSSARCCGSPPT